MQESLVNKIDDVLNAKSLIMPSAMNPSSRSQSISAE